MLKLFFVLHALLLNRKLGACLLLVLFSASQVKATDIDSLIEARLAVRRTNLTLRSIEYVGILVGEVNSRPGQLNSHRRHFKGSKGARYLDILHNIRGHRAEWDLNHNIVAYKPKFVETYLPFSNCSEVSRIFTNPRENPKLRGLHLDFYTCACGWLPELEEEEFKSMPKDIAMEMPLSLIFEDNNELTLTFEQVREFRCLKVEKKSKTKHQIVWVAPSLDYRLIQSELTIQKTGPNGMVQMKRKCVLSEYRKIDDVNVMLPLRVKRSLHAIDDSGNFSVLSKGELSIQELMINQLVEQDFKIEKPLGTITTDYETGEINREPGGLEIVENSVDLGAFILESQPNSQSSAFIYNLLIWIIFFAGVATSFVRFRASSQGDFHG